MEKILRQDRYNIKCVSRFKTQSWISDFGNHSVIMSINI